MKKNERFRCKLFRICFLRCGWWSSPNECHPNEIIASDGGIWIAGHELNLRSFWAKWVAKVQDRTCTKNADDFVLNRVVVQNFNWKRSTWTPVCLEWNVYEVFCCLRKSTIWSPQITATKCALFWVYQFTWFSVFCVDFLHSFDHLRWCWPPHSDALRENKQYCANVWSDCDWN